MDKHTSSGGGIRLDIQSISTTLDARSLKRDTIREVQGWTYFGPRELNCVGAPFGDRCKNVRYAFPPATRPVFV